MFLGFENTYYEPRRQSVIRKLFVALVSNREASKYSFTVEEDFRTYLFDLMKAVISEHDLEQLNTAA